jgi:hypothetical protein
MGKFRTPLSFLWCDGDAELPDVTAASDFLASLRDELKQDRDYDLTLEAVLRALRTDATKDVMEADEAMRFFIRKLPR